MDSHYQLAYYALWIGHPILQLVVAALMVWRKLYKKFRIFFLYLLAQIVNFGVVFPIYLSGNYQAFFYSYWIFAAISLVLGFLVIHEVFVDVFRPYHTLKDLGTVLFKWAGLVMFLVAGVVMVGSPPSAHEWIVHSVLISERCVRLIQCGLVLFLIIFSRYLGITWKQHSCGIALGFGGFALVELLVVAGTASHSVNQTTSSLLVMVTYNLTIMVWMFYMARKQRMPESAANLATQRWDQSLTDLQHPASDDDSLIPMFEGMVDRAFSRRHDVPAQNNVEKPQGNEKLMSSFSESMSSLIHDPLGSYSKKLW